MLHGMYDGLYHNFRLAGRGGRIIEINHNPLTAAVSGFSAARGTPANALCKAAAVLLYIKSIKTQTAAHAAQPPSGAGRPLRQLRILQLLPCSTGGDERLRPHQKN